MTRTFLIAMASAAAMAASTGANGAMQTTSSAPASHAMPGRTPTAPLPSSTSDQTSTMGTTMPGQTTPPTASTMPTAGMTGGSLVDTATANANLSTFVSAVRAAGLDTTLAGAGPFTVFAPTNDAFGRLAPGAVDTLMKPENKAALTKVLNYHVVRGSYTNDQLKQMVTQGGGTTTLTTVEGEPLTLSIVNGNIALQGVNGNKSYLTTPGTAQSNGTVHIVNGVLVPNLGGGTSDSTDASGTTGG